MSYDESILDILKGLGSLPDTCEFIGAGATIAALSMAKEQVLHGINPVISSLRLTSPAADKVIVMTQKLLTPNIWETLLINAGTNYYHGTCDTEASDFTLNLEPNAAIKLRLNSMGLITTEEIWENTRVAVNTAGQHQKGYTYKQLPAEEEATLVDISRIMFTSTTKVVATHVLKEANTQDELTVLAALREGKANESLTQSRSDLFKQTLVKIIAGRGLDSKASILKYLYDLANENKFPNPVTLHRLLLSGQVSSGDIRAAVQLALVPSQKRLPQIEQVFFLEELESLRTIRLLAHKKAEEF